MLNSNMRVATFLFHRKVLKIFTLKWVYRQCALSMNLATKNNDALLCNISVTVLYLYGLI